MGTLGDVIARLRRVLDRCGQARDDLNQGAVLLEEASAQYAHAMDGAHDPIAEEALGLLARSVADLNDAYRTLVALGERVQGYITSFEPATASGTSVSPSRRPPAPDPEHTPSVVSPERVEQLRRQLPPPVVRNSGQKTHGRWVAPDGSAQSMVSGEDELTARVNDVLKALGCPKLPARTASDVELKLAALMRDRGKMDPAMRHITVVINNRPCKGDFSCDELIPVILPEGYSLTVHAPNYRKRFTGGAKPWWR